ncbi:MAG: hypothetical protein JWN13_996 [Betaproteobacteria bacterium]|jgi:hypothetical protein|nr:hypothetical protein [Betaproteobacteria bacterium]MEA3154812.1 hypothetical protein [Betaproteobacteria bacterium]
MATGTSAWLSIAAIGVAFTACHSGALQHHSSDASVVVGENDVGGIVTSAYGAEAGVWVIAETRDLPTKFARIVVTDERGRYVIPDLPRGTYDVWVRGYGLIDSPKVHTEAGKILDLRAVVALTPAAAAEYYPAIYWYSMLSIPESTAFSATSNVKTQREWLNQVKTNGCITCHQIGNKATRTLPPEFAHIRSSTEAWSTRILSGQAMSQMVSAIGRLDTQLALKQFADWTDRIAAGALPATQPPRPAGVERNLVITLWDWSRPTTYMHDEISTDKRNPTVNPNGLIYGAPEESTDYIPVLDPVRHIATEVKHPVRDPQTPSSKTLPFSQSPYWGMTPIWDSQTSMHNPMFDERARVWFTARVRSPENPAFCRKGSSHPSAKVFPIDRANRHLSMYDPKTAMFTLISTCFQTHHLVFAEDANETLWTSGDAGNQVVGWFNRKLFEETGDEERSQGWTPLVLDTNGNGKRDEWVEPNQPLDPSKDKRIAAGFYGVAVNPVDGSVWGSALGFPGTLVRINPGPNPSVTALAEVFEYPLEMNGYGVRGMDIDRNGVVWSSLASGHLASFDRRRCKGPLNGPTATGKHCPDGWTLYPFPGPQFEQVKESGSAESSYYTWVDQFDTLGLGKNVPIATGNLNDGLLALVDGRFVTLRVPYPLGFYAKWMDGRIDDPDGAWKGRGLWATTSTRAPFHMEGGSGTRPKVVRFQLRPDPLAR